MVRDDPKWHADNMSKDQKEELVRELEDYWELHAVGCRAGNHAASEDGRKTFDKISKEVCIFSQPYRIQANERLDIRTWRAYGCARLLVHEPRPRQRQDPSWFLRMQ